MPVATDPPALLGQYRLLRKLGQGGMGTVFEALHVHLQSSVAVKVLRLDRGEPTERVARFTREMAAIGRLVDPHVVRALDAGVVEGTHYLAMELVDGCDAGRMLARGGALRPADACEIARQAALGLAAIERAGLVHRDIKPSNLLITRTGLVKIADLGLARLSAAPGAEDLTGSWQVVGTSDYMAPEQAEGSESLDIRTDLYSLGCTLFKLLAGHAPFESAEHPSLPSKLLAHRQAPVPELPPEILAAAPGLKMVIDRMLAKQPADRWSSPSELARELEKYTAGCNLTALVAKWIPERGAEDSPRSLEGASLSGDTFGSMQNPTESYVPRPTAAMPSEPSGWPIWPALGALGIAVVALAGWGFSALLANRDAQPEPAGPGLPVPPAAAAPIAPEPRLPGEPPRQPIDLDRAPALQWQRLLAQQPAALLWTPGRGISSWNFQAEQQQLTVVADDIALIGLGSTQSNQFTLQVRLHQSRWTGGVGLFFGYREGTDKEGRPTFQCQQLRLQENVVDSGKRTFNLLRGTLRGFRDAAGKLRIEPLNITNDEVPFPSGEQSCELTVAGGMLEKVLWNGSELPRLGGENVNRRFQKADYHGVCGVVVAKAGVVLRDAQFRRLEAER